MSVPFHPMRGVGVHATAPHDRSGRFRPRAPDPRYARRPNLRGPVRACPGEAANRIKAFGCSRYQTPETASYCAKRSEDEPHFTTINVILVDYSERADNKY